MAEELHYMSTIKNFKYFCLILVMTFIGCSSKYPSNEEIDSFYENYRLLTNDQQRIESLKIFLERLSNPDSTSEDKCLSYFLNKLTEEFLTTESEAILIAVDETHIDAGFATSISCFYSTVKDTETFKKRYFLKPGARKAIERCFPKAELNDMELNYKKLND